MLCRAVAISDLVRHICKVSHRCVLLLRHLLSGSARKYTPPQFRALKERGSHPELSLDKKYLNSNTPNTKVCESGRDRARCDEERVDNSSSNNKTLATRYYPPNQFPLFSFPLPFLFIHNLEPTSNTHFSSKLWILTYFILLRYKALLLPEKSDKASKICFRRVKLSSQQRLTWYTAISSHPCLQISAFSYCIDTSRVVLLSTNITSTTRESLQCCLPVSIYDYNPSTSS